MDNFIQVLATYCGIHDDFRKKHIFANCSLMISAK